MTRAVLAPELAFRDAPDRACLNRTDLDWFYGQGGNRHIPALAAICATCPHQAPCRDWAIRHEAYGYWAGTTQKHRVRERRRLGITLEQPQARHDAPVVTCGTDGGYHAHRRRGEETCASCRHAHSIKVAARGRTAA